MAEITKREYRIGSSEEYIDKVLGIFNSSVLFRNSSLMYNPDYRRYYSLPEAYSMIYNAEAIGEGYVKNDIDVKRENFLDDVGGLVGYTFGSGYLNTNNYRVISGFEELERNQKGQYFQTLSPFNRIAKPYYEKHEFKDNIKFLYDTELSYSPVVFDLTYLDRLYEYYTKEREINIYGNNSSFGEFNPIRHVVNQYYPRIDENDEGNEYVQSNSQNRRYSTNEETYYENGDSIDNNIDNSGYGTTVKREKNKTISYGLYDERNNEYDKRGLNEITDLGGLRSTKFDANDNYPSNVSLRDIEKDSSGLLLKTNELFRRGKIGSLINRFHSNVINKDDEITGAIDNTYGLSRGRNLTKKDVTYSNGYEDPYCRVWTSHYQYSKYKNAIRPSNWGETLSQFDETPIMKSLRPFEHIRNRSSLQDNGLPLIAPYSEGGVLNSDDIKKCMFSIENLAWRDINFNERVYNKKKTNGKREERGTTGRGNVLSAEQKGPNGGRIMWFPPYNLKFSENVGVNWNENSFIGRGENIYSYINTERSGQLQFTLLIDHPSILDKYSASVSQPNNDNDLEVLRFFAGCGELEEKDKINITEKVGSTIPSVNGLSVDPVPEENIIDESKMLFCFFPNNFSGEDFIKEGQEGRAINYLLYGGSNSGNKGYEGGSGNACTPINGCIDTNSEPRDFISCENKIGGFNKWYYQVDSSKQDEVLALTNYEDTKCFGLNNVNIINILTDGSKNSEILKNVLKIADKDNKVIENGIIPFSSIDLIKSYFDVKTPEYSYNKLSLAKKVRIRCVGYASKPGYENSNYSLALNRATLLQNYLIKNLGFDREWFEEPSVVNHGVSVSDSSISDFKQKIGRCAGVFIDIEYDDNVTLNRIDGDKFVSGIIRKVNNGKNTETQTANNVYTQTSDDLREANYDDEYLYFNKVNKDDDFVRQYITDKVKFFDPAFHSITPEGFNSRLTFLHQCTRQGPTVAVSDNNVTKLMAGNLAFGRPPVCVLRIGDFYNTKIIIDSISIDYDNSGGIQWDLNPEGIGIQPMMANVTIGFKFLGGSDLSGPISRLQNAVSYNFFANTSVYDRHADYRDGWIEEGKDDVNEWEAGINEDLKTEYKYKNDSFDINKLKT